MLRPFAMAALAVLAGCGGSGLTLSHLRCDQACQATFDPFTMTLVADYDDPDGALAKGKLAFTIDRVVQAGSSTALRLVPAPGGRSGTLHFSLPLKLTSVVDGERLTLGVRASGAGETSNEVDEDFEIHL